jgi:hypothetical protein
MIGPGVMLLTAGHPVEPAERFDGITTAPIVIGSNVWIGAIPRSRPASTSAPGRSSPRAPSSPKTCQLAASSASAGM